MGQCVSRGHKDPYSFTRHYDAESLASSISSKYSTKGHSESKGAKKRDKSAGPHANKLSRGVATSFGFRRRPASTSRADDNARKRNDRNGNGGSTEDLRVEDVLSGRSTPLARPRKENGGQPLRSNRFGSRQQHCKTAKVADVGSVVEHAFSANGKDKETSINNNALDKRSTKPNMTVPLASAQVTSSGTAVVSAAGVPKPVTKQTIILTYQPQQYAVQDVRRPAQARSTSVTRAPPEGQKPGRYTFQTNQLPRPQYPAVKNIDAKTLKQVVNNSRRGTHEVWREGAGSAVSSDSGVWTGCEGVPGCEGPGDSPGSRRRPRNLEMVMRDAHSFHLRELLVTDLDIMDDAVVTGQTVIPLPKLPSSFEDNSPEYDTPAPTYKPISPELMRRTLPTDTASHSSPMSTLDRYRTRTRSSRIQSIMDRDEEKFVLDRAQPELLNKQNSFIKSSSGVVSPPTVSSSKESSPSCKSEESHFGNSVWQTHAAGEAMATRSQDDVSIALSVSSCEDEKSKLDAKESQKIPEVEVPKKTIVIMDEPTVPHPLLMKSLTLSQHENFRSSMMGSMTGSNYSTTSTCTNKSADLHNLTLTLEESKFDLSALETSTQSLLDDETSPADSLISSTSTSDSSNDLQVERDPPSISSAYQTANTKTKSPEPVDYVDEEALQPLKEVNEVLSPTDGEDSKNVTPESPGTPTHASASLSLSDGKDFFDDEIADQPALLFRKNTEGSPPNKESEASKLLRRSRERIPASPLAQRNRKLGVTRNVTQRTASLDTLSSLASDDLMMDNDLAQSITSLQSVDDYIERLDSSLRSGLNSLDERQLRQELTSSATAVRQWSQLLEQSDLLDRQLAAMKDCPSVSSSQASLPVRTARLLQRSRAQTPSDAGLSDGSASPAPATLLQDVVDIKTLLLQLKRVLQEPGEEHHSMSSETLDPLLGMCNGRRPPASPLRPDASAEMRRQILYLQSQLEERDRAVRVLQSQMSRLAAAGPDLEPRDVGCNVATQTDRLRPPMSTALTSSENSGLVSWNEQSSGRRLPTYSEAQKNKRTITNGTVKCQCQCGARKLNGVTNDEKLTEKRPDTTLVKTSSRVGSKYLQALANSDTNRPYIKRDSSLGERNGRRALYSNRSRSIENFHNQNYLSIEPSLAKNPVIEESPLMKHQSYGDLYNGRISSRESVNGNRHSPSLNGQSTDTDYSSDGGYKSLPSSINCNNYSPKKVSGIPRRSIEQKFLSTKSVKASAI